MVQIVAQKLARVRRLARTDRLRRATDDHVPTGLTPFWAEINQVVSALDDLHIVLDYQQRVPLCEEPVKGVQELVNVLKVQARGRLIEDEQVRAPRCHAHMRGQLQPL